MKNLIARSVRAVPAAAGGAFLLAASAQAASDGCNQVNGGAFNRSGAGNQVVSTALTFEAGEVLVVTLTSSASGLKGASDDTAGNAFIVQGGTFATASYTIPASGSRIFTLVSNSSGSATIVVSCIEATATRRSDLEAAAKLLTSFVLNQIVLRNGQAVSDAVNRSFAGSFGPQFTESSGALHFRMSVADLKRLPAPARREEKPRQWAMAGHTSQPDQFAAGPAASRPRGPSDYDERRWNAWISGDIAGVNVDRAGAAFDGRLYSVLGGVDYKVVPEHLLIGIAGGWERYDLDTSFNGGTFKGTGYTVGPYLGLKIAPSLVLDLWAGWTRVNYDLTSNATGAPENGSFYANRVFVSANLTGHFQWNGFRITPRAGVIYAHERQPDYTGSLGNPVAAQTIELGKATFGPEIGYRFDVPSLDLTLEPFAFIRGEYDFVRGGTVTLGTTVVRPERWGARAGAGLAAATRHGLSLRLAASYDSIGRSGEQVIRGEARLGFRF